MIIDDLTQYEADFKLIEIFKPDIFCAGIKEKYAVQKHGIPMKQLHCYDYGIRTPVLKGPLIFTGKSIEWSAAGVETDGVRPGRTIPPPMPGSNGFPSINGLLVQSLR